MPSKQQIARIKNDESKLDVPTFTEGEVKGLLDPSPMARALAITNILKQIIPGIPDYVPSSKDKANQLTDAFDMAFVAVQGPARLVSYAAEDFPAFIRDYAALKKATFNIGSVNTGAVTIKSNTPDSPLNSHGIDGEIVDVQVEDDE